MAKTSLKNTWLGVSTIKQDQADLGTQITNNWNKTVRKNEKSILNFSGPSLVFSPNNNGDTYMEWRDGTSSNSRYAYFGRPSPNVDKLEWNVQKNIQLTTPVEKTINFTSGKVKVVDNDGILECKTIQMGYGSQNAWITPEDNSTKTLKFGINQKRFNLDLENASKIINVPNPTQAKEVANKEYVDNKIKVVNGTATIAGGSSNVVIDGLNTKEILSVYIRRKRNDNYWFSSHNDSLEFQVFEVGNEIKIYNRNIAPTNFSNEFKWTITYRDR